MRTKGPGGRRQTGRVAAAAKTLCRGARKKNGGKALLFIVFLLSLQAEDAACRCAAPCASGCGGVVRLKTRIYPAMKVIDFAESNSVINQFVAEIRDVDVQADRMRFRRNIERIGELMAYEMSKELTYSVKPVQTPLGVAQASTPDDDVVIGTVFRAGLPLHQGFLNVFDRAGNAFVSAYRYYKDKECRTLDVHIEYIATPDLSGKTLMLVDPMLATGESMELAYKAFLTKGRPARLLIACVIASRQGVEHLQRLFPDDDVTLWCAAIDPELNERSYIVPGLGDAGDLAYGEKL